MTVDVKKEIMRCLESVGILLSTDDEDEDIDLREIDIDSLQFISFVLEMETSLGIEIPDEYLLIDYYASLNAFSDVLSEIIV